MSQPALTHPRPPITLPRPLDHAEVAPAHVTYGALLEASRNAATTANEVVIGVGDSALTARSLAAVRDELDGYERFLMIATGHIRTLLRVADIPVANHWDSHISVELRPRALATDGNWNRAAETLAAANDLLVSHFTTSLLPRSAEARDRLVGPEAAGSCAEVTTFLLDAITDSPQLMALGARARREQRTLGVSSANLVGDAALRRLAEANRSAGKSGRSTMWELRHVSSADGPSLNQLQPALTISQMRSTPFDSSLDALRVLREIARRQASHSTPASPASLRDLTLIASRVLDRAISHSPAQPAEARVPSLDFGLDALRRAHTRDLLEDACQAWHQAGVGLTTRIRGITRAPAAYAQAATVLNTREPTSAEQRALLTALPALAHDASQAVEQLTADGNLATPQVDPLATRPAWRPITREQGNELADRFSRAEHTTRRAATALLSLDGNSPQPSARTPQPRQRQARLDTRAEEPSCTR